MDNVIHPLHDPADVSSLEKLAYHSPDFTELGDMHGFVLAGAGGTADSLTASNAS